MCQGIQRSETWRGDGWCAGIPSQIAESDHRSVPPVLICPEYITLERSCFNPRQAIHYSIIATDVCSDDALLISDSISATFQSSFYQAASTLRSRAAHHHMSATDDCGIPPPVNCVTVLLMTIRYRMQINILLTLTEWLS